jgi:phosphotransferase system HPr-like phosphotransfer protein
MRASLDQAMGTAHGLSHNADLGCYMEYNEQVIITLANEVKRLQAEIKLQNKDWCEDDEAIKQQALRVLDAAKVEGDSVYVPRMGALAEMMADEIERLRIWNKRWRDVSARLRLTLAELITEELKQGKHYET